MIIYEQYCKIILILNPYRYEAAVVLNAYIGDICK